MVFMDDALAVLSDHSIKVHVKFILMTQSASQFFYVATAGAHAS